MFSCEFGEISKNIFFYRTPQVAASDYTDSSTLGWGVTDGYNLSGGRWKAEEINHINVLEVKATFIGVQTYCKGKNYKHVRVMSDNIIISYVNNIRGIKSEFCNEIADELWVCCTPQNMWISAAHILEHKILRQTVFLETLMRLLSGN